MTLQPGKRLVRAGGKKLRRLQLEMEILQVSREFVVQEGCWCSEVRCPGAEGAQVPVPALVTQEGAVDSPEMPQGSPGHGNACEQAGEGTSGAREPLERQARHLLCLHL